MCNVLRDTALSQTVRLCKTTNRKFSYFSASIVNCSRPTEPAMPLKKGYSWEREDKFRTSLEELITPGDGVRVIDAFVDGLDLGSSNWFAPYLSFFCVR